MPTWLVIGWAVVLLVPLALLVWGLWVIEQDRREWERIWRDRP